jgi:hypothetical protein
MAAVASAASPGFNVGLQYVTSFDSLNNDVGPLPSTAVIQSDGSLKTTISLNGTGVTHEFNMFLSVHDLAAGQNALYFQFNKLTTGGVITNGPNDHYDSVSGSIDPPSMGNSVSGYSDAPAADWANIDSFNGTAFAIDLKTGSSSTGPGNGTYGDYAAIMNFVDPGPPQDPGFKVGTLYLTASDVGTFGYQFNPNPGYFKVLNNNLNGLGTVNDFIYPAYVARGDMVSFSVIPEPGTIVLLVSSLMGLLCYAWRKRR